MVTMVTTLDSYVHCMLVPWCMAQGSSINVPSTAVPFPDQ